MRTVVHQMGLEEQVIFAGFVSSADYGCLLNGCKAMVFPSLFEGFGLPVLEAMRFGKPVFCSSTTSLPEVGGDAAGTFDPRRPQEILQALEIIAYEPKTLKAMAEKSALQAARFPDVRRWAQDYLNLLTQILDGGQNS
jgi:glycosyltransferase involved in cell wall biosynthesis